MMQGGFFIIYEYGRISYRNGQIPQQTESHVVLYTQRAKSV